MTVLGRYFDGNSAVAHAVQVEFRDGQLQLRGTELARQAALGELQCSEPLRYAPRILSFADGAYLELPETDELQGLLAAHGHRKRWVVSAQAHLGIIFLSSVLLLAGGFSAWRWGLPPAAQLAAQHTPIQLRQLLGEQTLLRLDASLFEDSELDPERQSQLRQGLISITEPGAESPQLVFRKSPVLGANALALPGGTIVLLDELVAIADNDEQVVAVLGHELGHVVFHHGLRMLYQSSVTALAATWLFGDVSALIAAAPTVLLQAHYSREFEREADRYALLRLSAAGLPPGALLGALEGLVDEHGVSRDRPTSFLDSHPAPAQRFAEIRSFIGELQSR